MAYKLLDRARMSVSGSPGTGNITLGSAAVGYQTFVQAGINNGDSFPYVAIDGNNWEYGVATYSSTGGVLTRTVTKTSAQNSSPLSLSSATLVTSVLREEDISQGTTLVSLTDVNITNPAVGQDGYAVVWNNTDSAFELAQITYASLPDKPSIPANSGFLLNNLGDVNSGASSFTNGYALTWNQSTGKYVLAPMTGGGGGGGSSTLSGLTDVNLSSPANNQALVYNSGASKWENQGIATVAFTGVYSDLTGRPSIPSNSAFDLAGLGDTNISPGGGVDGYSVIWNNASSKFILSNVAAGGAGIATQNSGVAVGTGQTTLNFVNASSVVTSGTTTTITVPTGGGGGGSSLDVSLTPPVASALTASTNLNSATLTTRTAGTAAVQYSSLHVKPGATDATATFYGACATAPSGDFSMCAKIKFTTLGPATNQLQGAGIMLRDGTTGYFYAWILNFYNGVFEVCYSLATGGLSSWAWGGISGKTVSPTDDIFLHLDYTSSTHTMTLSMSRNGLDKIVYFTDTIITNPGYCGICWADVYGTMGTTSQIGPEYDFLHYFCGTAGSNGI